MGRQYLPGGDENEVVSDWHAVVTCRPAVACFGIGGRRRLSCDVGGQPGAFPAARSRTEGSLARWESSICLEGMIMR